MLTAIPASTSVRTETFPFLDEKLNTPKAVNSAPATAISGMARKVAAESPVAMARIAPRLAPLVIPSTPVSAIGFLYTPWMTAPDTAKPMPVSMLSSTRGKRMLKRMLVRASETGNSAPNSSLARIFPVSSRGMATEPMTSPRMNMTASAKPKTINTRFFLICQAFPYYL